MKFEAFEVNYDLNKIILDFHNSIHLLGSFVLAVLFGFWISYGLFFLHEITDGFKPWYYAAPPKIKYAIFPSVNWFKKELLYSDKFSCQDAFIWNLGGALLGTLLKYLIWS